MFGYVTINPGALSKSAVARYRGFYCGLCRTLGQRYGNKGRITLSNAMTFLLVLLSSLYEPEEVEGDSFCAFHPTKKQAYIQTEFSEYVADMNIILAYHKCMDDWVDDRSAAGLMQAKLLEGAYQKVQERYPGKCKIVSESLKHIGSLEKENIADVDSLANLTGKMLGEIYKAREDYWANVLRTMGEAMGRFVYMMDAYDDLPSDLRKKRFNPLVKLHREEEYEPLCKDSLSLLIAECAEAFELLPLEKDVDILRNILYCGVWTRFAKIQQKRSQKDKLKETEKNT